MKFWMIATGIGFTMMLVATGFYFAGRKDCAFALMVGTFVWMWLNPPEDEVPL